MSDKHIVEYRVANVIRGKVGENEEGEILGVEKSLADAVNEMIADGFQPHGSPFVNTLTQLPAQAMVRYSSDKPLKRPSPEVLTGRS